MLFDLRYSETGLGRQVNATDADISMGSAPFRGMAEMEYGHGHRVPI